ncbi:unnamed protein product [Tilletia controversa]|uniref:ABC transporter domain-containing protein n=1 Tax=Tilletia caries TaxID=13290 RepID=A0A177VFS5_9BASI|nr:hypothetical protein CF336_g5229 [Tilletia laevis]KAE8258653.1 hypothetical protein A4X03_0g4317 [Tilletia caries]CAD6896715.1 unnamed protein product [Tilletia controversa]KAE8207282.1 hypothetical protein CF335_g1257 [Tilletia laevis]CAD6886551.1 unnamed protein product [Tilletia caries]
MSGLELFQQCPPGLGGTNCTQASCQSTYVQPAQRTLKSNNDAACTSCDNGFAGINCNVCSGQNSCQAAKSALSSGSSSSSGTSTAGIFPTVNQTLTCYPQPEVITQSFTDCDVNQPTLSALFPGILKLSLIRVQEPDNATLTAQPSWPAQKSTTLSSVWLDGVQQFYCQALGCSGGNQTQAISKDANAAQWGTYNWTCSSLQCYCIPGTKICSGGALGIQIAPIIASINGSLSLPCDYADPANQTATHACAFKGEILQNFLGRDGLPLQNCRSGSCIAQGAIDTHWASEATANGNDAGGSDKAQLTGGVIAGLVVLGLVLLGLLSLVGLGLFFRRRAALKPRSPPTGPVGLRWTNLAYTLPRPGKVQSAVGHVTAARRRRNASTSMRGKKAHESSMIVMDDLGSGDLHRSTNASPECLLQSVSGFAAPGKMVAILGPSGAGKTTLIDLLAGRAKAGTQAGQVAYLYTNDAAATPEASQAKMIAYVDQEDQLPALSTVREALEFAATLSHAENVPSHERAQLVNHVLDALGLTHIGHRRIGDARRRGISGGEKRRVSIGLALVARPRILILDEPLSGLDSYSADRVVDALRKLANNGSGNAEGTTVLMTLHQPSSLIFHSFDEAILLARGGRTIYHGPPGEAMGWCERNGEPCPLGHNVADHLLLVAHRMHGHGTGPAGGSSSASAAPSVLEKPAGAGADDDDVERYRSVLRAYRRRVALEAGERTPTTFFTQLMAVSGRFWRHAWRDPSGPLAHLIVTVIVALIIGGCFFQVNLSIGGFQNRFGSIFFMFIFLAFLSLSATTSLGTHRPLMMRERANGLYGPLAWLLSFVVYDLVLVRLVCAVVLSVVAYWMVGLNESGARFFEFVLVACLFTVDMALYDMCLAAGMHDLSTAVLSGGANILFQLGFAGFLLNVNSIPGVLRWLQWIACMKYAMEAVGSNELNDLRIVDNLGGVPIDAPASLVAPTLFGFKPFYYRDVLILALPFLLGFFAILTITVHVRMRELR